MSIVAKRSPISATAELVYIWHSQQMLSVSDNTITTLAIYETKQTHPHTGENYFCDRQLRHHCLFSLLGTGEVMMYMWDLSKAAV